jgi:hypothetical protein
MVFCPKGKKTRFTPYNQGVKLLIIYRSCKKVIVYCTSEYFKGCECNKGTFYTYVLQHFIYDHNVLLLVIILFEIFKIVIFPTNCIILF